MINMSDPEKTSANQNFMGASTRQGNEIAVRSRKIVKKLIGNKINHLRPELSMGIGYQADRVFWFLVPVITHVSIRVLPSSSFPLGNIMTGPEYPPFGLAQLDDLQAHSIDTLLSSE